MTDRPRQQGLFGPLDDGAKPTARTVAPAAVPDDVRSLAQSLPEGLRLGTSSWSFAGWSGIVYAAGTRQQDLPKGGLAAYAQHPLLRTVGLDRAFYAPLPVDEYAALAAAVPAGFRFLVKAWGELLVPMVRDGSGERRNARHLDAALATDLVLAPARQGLGDRLGPIVFQFSPQGSAALRAPGRFAERVHAFLSALPQPTDCAVELRDAALLTFELVTAVRATGAGIVHCVHPRLPELRRQLELAPLQDRAVVRWMLAPGSGYDEAKARLAPFDRLAEPDVERRTAVADLCREALARRLPVTVVVNNKAEGSAPRSVLELARAIAR